VKVAVFEGPEHARGKMCGWRAVMVIIFTDDGKMTTRTAFTMRVEQFAANLRAKLFRFGTWELSEHANGIFPAPRPEILDEILHGKSEAFSA